MFEARIPRGRWFNHPDEEKELSIVSNWLFNIWRKKNPRRSFSSFVRARARARDRQPRPQPRPQSRLISEFSGSFITITTIVGVAATAADHHPATARRDFVPARQTFKWQELKNIILYPANHWWSCNLVTSRSFVYESLMLYWKKCPAWGVNMPALP